MLPQDIELIKKLMVLLNNNKLSVDDKSTLLEASDRLYILSQYAQSKK